MPVKLGKGGEGQEQYNPNDGKYVEDGIPNKSTFTKKNNLGNELTPQQEEYFQNSKVRDENGNLMIMYHSSNVQFDVFDLNYANLKDNKLQGFWFTNNKEQKNFYGNNSLSVYVNINNPINRQNITLSIEQIKKLASVRGLSNRVNEEILKRMIDNGTFTSDYDIILYFSPRIDNQKYKDYVSIIQEATGYDGYILEDYDQQATYAVAFNPNQIKLITNQNPTNSDSISDGQTQTNNTKQQQLEIIQKHNPAPNDINTWIRDVNDIKTLSETLEDSDYADYEEYNPDWTKSMAQEAINSGYVTVYSSYPIEQGVFVSPSRMEAQSYAGNGRVYSKKVPVNSIAWIDPTQGQYANTEEAEAMKYFNLGDE